MDGPRVRWLHALEEIRSSTRSRDHCGRPVRPVVVEYHDRGPSHRGNGQARREQHHTMRHLPGVTVTHHPDGTTTWVINGNNNDLILILIDDDDRPPR